MRIVIKELEKRNVKYVSILEGDDYWIDSERLLILHQLCEIESVVCSANAYLNEYENGTYSLEEIQQKAPEICNDIEYYKNGCFIKNFSSSFFDKNVLITVCNQLNGRLGDTVIHTSVLKYGQLYYTKKPMTVRRRHRESITAQLTQNERIDSALVSTLCLKDFFYDNKIMQKLLEEKEQYLMSIRK